MTASCSYCAELVYENIKNFVPQLDSLNLVADADADANAADAGAHGK